MKWDDWAVSCLSGSRIELTAPVLASTGRLLAFSGLETNASWSLFKSKGGLCSWASLLLSVNAICEGFR